MTKGMQNRDSELAYNHVMKSLGEKRKCNGIFHKGYPGGDRVDASRFKRQGSGYQAFCSDCDQARQNIQKTLKRMAAIIMSDKKFRIKLPSEFKKQEEIINKKISSVIKNSKNILELYTRLVKGEDKLSVKELGLYETDLTVQQKKNLIETLNKKVRNSKNNYLVRKKLEKIGSEYKFRCSRCNGFFPVSEVQPNISQSRDVFYLDERPTNYKLPLHNVCLECMKGNRAESKRQYKYLCDGDFLEASKKMSRIARENENKNIHADHIIPLRLGGKHDPENIRPFAGEENIKKRDNLTKESLDFINEKNIPFKRILTDWYYPEYEKIKNNNIKVIEIALRHAVDKKREKIKKLPYENKKKELLKLYPTLNSKEINRIIRKFFS